MSMDLGAALPAFQMSRNTSRINSIAASRLVDVAKALDVPPSFFFLRGPSPKGQVGGVHTRNLRAGPRIIWRFKIRRVRRVLRTNGQLATTPLSRRRGA